MNLKTNKRLLIGALTLIDIIIPIFMIIDTNNILLSKILPVDLFGRLVILPIFLLGNCIYPLLTIGMIIFYIYHILKNRLISDTSKLLFILGIVFLSIIVKPYYYILFIFKETPPGWFSKGLENKGILAINENIEKLNPSENKVKENKIELMNMTIRILILVLIIIAIVMFFTTQEYFPRQ